jgi:hypothetical protein
MKDGVEYLLRFGNGTTVASADAAVKDEAASDAAGNAAAAEGESTGRYLFVTARFNESLLEKPALDPLPDAPAEGEGTKDREQGTDKDNNKDDAAKPSDKGQAEGAADELKKAEEAEAKAQAALAERRRVEGENRRKQEQYDEQVTTAQKRVRDLNNRFADWYYVVSDAEYAKIHLDRAGVIQAKAADASAKTEPQ